MTKRLSMRERCSMTSASSDSILPIDPESIRFPAWTISARISGRSAIRWAGPRSTRADDPDTGGGLSLRHPIRNVSVRIGFS